MMLLQSAVAVLALASGVVSQKPYAVTGVPTDIKNGVPLRLNINQLQSNGGAQWYGKKKQLDAFSFAHTIPGTLVKRWEGRAR